jgi:CRP/FNR family transcriptional regulator
LLIPVQKVNEWITKFPELNALFFQQYKVRYSDLLQTIHHVLFDKLDTRLLSYLAEKEKRNKSNPVKIPHREIAHDLGTAREVISRVLKKLELEGKILQQQEGISLVKS